MSKVLLSCKTFGSGAGGLMREGEVRVVPEMLIDCSREKLNSGSGSVLVHLFSVGAAYSLAAVLPFVPTAIL